MAHKIPGTAENWENGTLGNNPDTMVAASPEENAAIEQAIGLNMQLISMRLPKDMIKMLKDIAAYRGVGYQPMVRDVLQRWAATEVIAIYEELKGKAQRMKDQAEQSDTLAGDLRKTA